MPIAEASSAAIPSATPFNAGALSKRIDARKLEKFYTPNDVSAHNEPKDLWVSWLGNVYDLTPLVEAHANDHLLKPIIANAGCDLSHWFDPTTHDLQTHVDPITGVEQYYTPQGRFIDVPPSGPRSDWNNDIDLPWWRNHQKYCIGKLTSKSRKIRVINTLSSEEHILEVASEEKLGDIQERYQKLFNSHAKGYMWKYLGLLLDMAINLSDNGIKNDSDRFDKAGLDENEWLPAIHLYFSDDLTVA